MKKIILTLVAGSFISISAFAQIPNGGFENWTSMGSYNNPDGWATMNNMTNMNSVYTAEKGMPGNVGASYLKLTSKMVGANVVNGMAVSGKMDSMTMMPMSGFAFSMRPASFTGNWQHMLAGSSQGSVSVTLTRWDVGMGMRMPVATASQTLSGMAMSWSAFSINFTYTDGQYPDTCIIVMKASGATPTAGDYLYVDNLAFAGSVAGIQDNKGIVSDINLYPNPTSENLMINFNLAKSENVNIQIIDMVGKVVAEDNLGSVNGQIQHSVNVKNLAKGMYFVNVIADNSREVRKVVIE